MKPPEICLLEADCLDILENLDDKSYSAACFSPPYGVGEYFDIRHDFKTPDSKFLKYLIPLARVCNVVAVNFGQLSHPDRSLSTFTEELVCCAKSLGIHLIDRWVLEKSSCRPQRGFRVLNPMEFVLLFSTILPKEILAHEPTKFKTVIKAGSKVNYAAGFSAKNTGTTPYFIDIPHQVFSVYGQSGGPVMDPFCGSGTSLVAARELGLDAVGIDICPEILEVARHRLSL
jgi:hypothetical protein